MRRWASLLALLLGLILAADPVLAVTSTVVLAVDGMT